MELAGSQQYIRSLTGLRGVAAFIVVLGHFSSQSLWFGGLLGKGAGQIGVIIFYALSSWLMMHIYHQEDSGALSRRFVTSTSFLWNRISRIFPLYLSMLILSFLLGLIAPSLNLYDIHLNNFWRYATFLDASSVLWSIGPEVLFYAIFSIILLMPSWLRVAAIALMSVASLALYLKPELNWVEASGFHWGRLTENFFVYKIFIAGCLLNLIHRSMTFNISRSLGVLVSFLIPAALIICYPKIGVALLDISTKRYGWDDPAVVILIMALLTFAMCADPLRWVLATRPLVFLGEISFSVYLSHFMILNLMIASGLLVPNVFSFLLALILCVVLAFALYSAIERPSRRLLRALPGRLADRLGRSAMAPQDRTLA